MKNKIRNRGFQAFSNILMLLVCIMIIMPFMLMFISSVTDENVLTLHGYSLLPEIFGIEAYSYIFKSSGMVLKSYGLSMIITVIGTAASLILTCLIAYPLSRKNFRFRGFFTFFVFFTMLFNGGLVSQYMMWATIFKIRNTIAAYLFPNLLMNAFNIMIIRNYFSNSVTEEVIESAIIDGSGEFSNLFHIVLPMSKPILAAIGLMIALGYWNDWTNGLYYINKPELYTFQNLLNRMIQQINLLSSGQAAQFNNMTIKVPSVSVRMAIATIGVLPMLISYPFFQKYFAGGLTLGAVKG